MQAQQPESPIPVYPIQYDHGASQIPPTQDHPHSPRTELLSAASQASRGSGGTHMSSEERTEPHNSRRRGAERWKRAKERAHAAHTRDELVILLIHAESDIKKLQKSLSTTQKSVLDETNRSLEAERSAKDLAVRLRQAMDEKNQFEHDAHASQEEVRMCKLRLEHSKTEMERAQRTISTLTRQRNEAEESASRARSIARKLDQRRMVDSAREEGRRIGFEAGFKRAQHEFSATNRMVEPNAEYSIAPEPAPTRREAQPAHTEPEPEPDLEDNGSYSLSDEDFDHPTTPPESAPLRPFIPPSVSNTPQSTIRQKQKAPRHTHRSRRSNPPMPEPIAQSAPYIDPPPVIPPEPTQRPIPTQPSHSSRKQSHAYRHSPSPSIDMYSVDIPAASVVERTGNINPAQHVYSIPPDNYIPVGTADGGISLPPPHEFTPHPTTPAPLPEPPLGAPSGSVAHLPQEGTDGNRRASWYQQAEGGQGQTPTSAASQNWYPPPPQVQPKRRGSLLGSIGRSVGAALGFKKQPPPQRGGPATRINLDSPDSEGQTQPAPSGSAQAPPPQAGSTASGTQPLNHRKSKSTGDDLEARLASLRNPAQTPYGVALSNRSHRSGAGSQDLTYSRPEAVDQWRAATSLDPKSPRSGRRGGPNMLSPSSRSSGKHLFVANQSESDLAALNPGLTTDTSGTVGIKVEPPSSTSQITPKTPGSQYHNGTAVAQRPPTGYYPSAGVASSAGSASGRKPRSRSASVTGPLHPALQNHMSPSRPGSAASHRSRSYSVSGGGPQAGSSSEIPAVRRIPSTSSMRSGYSGKIANDGNYQKYDPTHYTDIALYQPETPVEPDTPTRQNTLYNSGVTPKAQGSLHLPSHGTPAGPSRSLRSGHGGGPGSSGTSMYGPE